MYTQALFHFKSNEMPKNEIFACSISLSLYPWITEVTIFYMAAYYEFCVVHLK